MSASNKARALHIFIECVQTFCGCCSAWALTGSALPMHWITLALFVTLCGFSCWTNCTGSQRLARAFTVSHKLSLAWSGSHQLTHMPLAVQQLRFHVVWVINFTLTLWEHFLAAAGSTKHHWSRNVVGTAQIFEFQRDWNVLLEFWEKMLWPSKFMLWTTGNSSPCSRSGSRNVLLPTCLGFRLCLKMETETQKCQRVQKHTHHMSRNLILVDDDPPTLLFAQGMCGHTVNMNASFALENLGSSIKKFWGLVGPVPPSPNGYQCQQQQHLLGSNPQHQDVA